MVENFTILSISAYIVQSIFVIYIYIVRKLSYLLFLFLISAMAPPIRIDDLNEFPPLRKSMNNVMLTPLNTDWIPDHVSSLAPKEETSNCSPIMLDDIHE